MLKSLLALSALVLSTNAFAAGFSGVVRCNIAGSPKDVIELRLRDGKIVLYSANKIANSRKGSEFENLGSAKAQKEGWFEYTNSVVARNGAAILIAGTTADEFQIGVNKDLQSGFYNYRDTGSGNGNRRYPMTCKAL